MAQHMHRTRHSGCRAGCPPPHAATCQDKPCPLSCTLTADPNRKEQRKRMYLIGCSSRAGRWNQNTSFVRWFARQPRQTCLHGRKWERGQGKRTSQGAAQVAAIAILLALGCG